MESLERDLSNGLICNSDSDWLKAISVFLQITKYKDFPRFSDIPKSSESLNLGISVDMEKWADLGISSQPMHKGYPGYMYVRDA